MSGKQHIKKGIESLETQITVHLQKLKKAEVDGNVGLVKYYEKEIEHFQRALEKLKRKMMPK